MDPSARTDLGDGAWIDYDPGWLPEGEASDLFTRLAAEQAWEHRPIVVFGKEILQPRLIAWAGELPYRYSGQTLPPRPMEGALAELTARVCAEVGVPFNHVLLNRYRDGQDNMGRHADDEWELGRDPTIAALSLGAVRRFDLLKKGKGKRRPRRSIPLAHGSLLVMGGSIQHRFWHAVPKAGAGVGERINVTFRLLLGPPGCRPKRPAQTIDLAPVTG